MQPTPYDEINGILDDLLLRIQRILGAHCAGLYLYGSLVTGDFDPELSDLDLLCVTSIDLNDTECDALLQMHDDLATTYTKWDNRIEVQYLSTAALQTFRSHTSKMAVISPGEPFHVIEAGADWTMNWYVVRTHGITLSGPSPDTFIAPIAKEEFIRAVQQHTAQWAEWITQMPTAPKSQAYAILTMCRALYTHSVGEQVSKLQAARWAQRELPEWSQLIQDALTWREQWSAEHVADRARFPDTLRFVHTVIRRVGTHSSTGH